MKYSIAILVIFFLFQETTRCQNVFTNLKSLEKRADKHFNEMSYMSAIDLYKQLIVKPKHKGNYKIQIKIARSYLRIGQTEEAEQFYRDAMRNGFIPGRRDSTQFARILIVNNKSKEATSWLLNSTDQGIDPLGFEQYKSISQIHKLYRDSFSFTVKPIIYNTEYSDYSPVFYKKGVVFSSDRPTEKLIKQVNLQKDAGFTELYFFMERDSVKRPAQMVSLNLKSALHKGPVLFYDKGNKMIITANAKKGEVSRLQMFTAEWDEKKSEWKNFQPLPFNSEFYSVGHPALSKDERTLYYVSDMPGGSGGTDIYVSVLKDGEWTNPKNMREPINTEGNEMFPYISATGKFYFSSDGHGGLGGLDFFYLENNQNVQKVCNPGYPLNSSADDFGIVLDEEEATGYFSSNRKGGKGSDDIYALSVKRIELRLKVMDEIATSSLLNPEVKLIDVESEEVVKPVKLILAKENNINYVLKPHHEYKLVVHKDDYKDFEKSISTMNMEEDQLIEMKAVLKRKFEYYATLKIRDEETENIVENSFIQLINLSTLELDSLGLNKSGELDIKLDSDSDYLLVAFKGGQFGKVIIEKPGKKKVSSVRFITLKISETGDVKNKVMVSDSLGKTISGGEVVIKDMITGSEEKIQVSEAGEIVFSLKGGWYYRIYYNNRQYFYDSLKKESTGSLKFFAK